MADAEAFRQYLEGTLLFHANVSNAFTNNGIISAEELSQLNTTGINDLIQMICRPCGSGNGAPIILGNKPHLLQLAYFRHCAGTQIFQLWKRHDSDVGPCARAQ